MLNDILICVLTFTFVSYLLPHLLLCYFCRGRNLKKAYGADWALVTGASSGIGKALAKRLATQGLNVVLVALDDPLLSETAAELQKNFSSIQIRKVGVNLGRTGYLDAIAQATADINVQLIFNNAGYMITGFFESSSLEQQMACIECNATSAVAITHHFLEKLVASKQKGAIVFTSSAAACIASPFTALYSGKALLDIGDDILAYYGGTKSFLSSFGAALAVEVRRHGIDVLVFHPSPVNTRFYDKAHSLSVIEFFKGRASSPDDIPDSVFGSIGRTVWRDVGPDAVAFRLAMKLVDYNLLALVTAWVAPLMPDFKKAQEHSRQGGKKAS